MKIMLFAYIAVSAFLAFGEGFESAKIEYPEWSGLIEKNRASGRLLSPSDLRHRFVLVIDVDMDKIPAQIENLPPYNFLLGSIGEGFVWMGGTLNRNAIVLIVVHSPKNIDMAELKEKIDVLTKSERMHALMRPSFSGFNVYTKVTFDGATDSTNKRPYAHFFDPATGKVAIEGKYDGSFNGKIRDLYNKGKGRLSSWRPFYGTIDEPAHFPKLKPTIAARKPLTRLMQDMAKKARSKNEELASEAQILYDALEQTRSDLVHRIGLEYKAAPHCAVADINTLVTYWPNDKKAIGEILEKLKAVPDAKKLGDMYVKLIGWENPDFTPKNQGEVKKIIGELNKMNKFLESFKEGKPLPIQNAAFSMQSTIETLISELPTRVPQK